MSASPGTTEHKPTTTASRTAWTMLIMATIGFAVNFWAWALLSPLGPLWREEGTLGDITEGDVALLVAVPVIVGSLGRIPVGGLTDKYGGRVMFPIVSLATIVPVLVIGFGGQSSLTALLITGFFLGIGGTAFAIGVPFVNAWFPPSQRGLAIGIFGAGMGGTAISALTTVPLYEASETLPFLLTAVGLAVFAVAAWFIMRDAPGRTVPPGSLVSRVVANSKLSITWLLAFLYAVAFGGYVAFSVYLPSYLKITYDLDPGDASNRMAGFVVVAVIFRPIGGWLADKFGAIYVLAACFVAVAIGATIASFTPILEHVGTFAFLGMAAALGAGSGATFALIAKVTEPARVGGVTGIVGACGGLGGFLPPLLMGYIYGRTDSYALGLLLLAATALVALALTITVIRRKAEEQAALEA
ncbi:NarK/NasA family nitrate transporter [Ornithinimicrobium sp. F0845]|uniref:nitrate/nitrite transporter n=1 Tax=Ornithinimicrobium sp. F0845 TaxID=2926412 RepID=UPI001FF53FB0|nr:NarK/NasA family nitrate transporter [Ornithinimicrobium sp. F0845]MCK0113178.1 NarK/NasA family nitrate transporter [Ornithinimicrobium sp. F0845]